jgi:hypothetical protein
MNDSLYSGSMLPYVAQAIARKWAVVVLDANVTDLVKKRRGGGSASAAAAAADTGSGGEEDDDDVRDPDAVLGSENPRRHVLTAWNDYIRPAAAPHVMFVAHSAGGYGVVNLLVHQPDALRRICAIAFTDSAHKLEKIRGVRKSPAVLAFLRQHTQNWVRSSKRLDASQPDKQVRIFACVVCVCDC